MLTAGCLQLNSQPTARPQESENTAQREHVEVVANSTSQELRPAQHAKPDLERVRHWIEQVRRRDDVRTRLEQRDPDVTTSNSKETIYSNGPPDAAANTAADSDPRSQRQENSTASHPAEAELAGVGVPRLGRVKVRAEAQATTPAATQLEPPSVNAPAQTSIHTPELPELVEQWLAQPVETSFRGQLDRRVLQVLTGKHEDARQPLELVSDEQQQIADHLIETLIAIREAHGGEPSAEANRVLAELNELSESLLPLSDLQINELILTRAVRGFGRYEALIPPHFPAGRENEFVVYCELKNFLSQLGDDGKHESRFSMRTTVLSRAGDAVLELKDEHIVDECWARRHDCFIPRLIRLPATLSPGEYVVKVSIVDKIGQKVAEQRTTFRIVARS